MKKSIIINLYDNYTYMENKELKERFIDERTAIEYVRQGDYYISNLVLPKQKKIH